MSSTGRRGKNAERLPSPGLKRPSNPSMVAKAAAPAIRPAAGASRRARGARRTGARALSAPLPASVTMGPVHVLHLDGKEPPPELSAKAARAGVAYRLVVRDADGKPIVPRIYKIRKHVLPVSASGCLAPGETRARITTVALDADASAFDVVEVKAAAASAARVERTAAAARRARAEEPAAGEETVFEYFSFEHGGVTYAIPQSGFLVVQKQRGRRVEVTRVPRAGGSIHGAVVAGLVTDGGGDGYSFEV